jgi:hypothetical protein
VAAVLDAQEPLGPAGTGFADAPDEVFNVTQSGVADS